jgi:hypothetical protein
MGMDDNLPTPSTFNSALKLPEPGRKNNRRRDFKKQVAHAWKNQQSPFLGEEHTAHVHLKHAQRRAVMLDH